jgi:hypothetical protein
MTNQEQYLEKLTEATTSILIDTGQKLYTALREQNYELAAKLHSTNQQIVYEAAKSFHQQQPLLSIEFYTNHFQTQVDYIHNELLKEFGPVI